MDRPSSLIAKGSRGRGVLIYLRGKEMRGHDVAQELEPEHGELREDSALVRDACRQDAVERGDTVSGDDEQLTPDAVYIANFASGVQL